MSRQNELLYDKSAEAMTHEGDRCASRGLWRLVGRAQAAAEAAKRFSIGVSSVVRWNSAFGSPVASPPGQWAWTRNPRNADEQKRGRPQRRDSPSKWWTPLISSCGSRKVFDGYSARNVSTTLRQPAFEFKLGFLAF